ncbi:hypothetical protein J7K74_03740 [Candidatus Woesearchaeota archaeon]|nr:hypothetical protein [Candidatus Woesearchaeota archaeon]
MARGPILDIDAVFERIKDVSGNTVIDFDGQGRISSSIFAPLTRCIKFSLDSANRVDWASVAYITDTVKPTIAWERNAYEGWAFQVLDKTNGIRLFAVDDDGNVIANGYIWGAHKNIVRVVDSTNVSFTGPVTIISGTITTHGKCVLIMATFNLWCDTANKYLYIALYRGTTELARWNFAVASNGYNDKPVTIHWIDCPSAGTYTYSIKIVYVSGGTWDTRSRPRVLTLIELQ